MRKFTVLLCLLLILFTAGCDNENNVGDTTSEDNTDSLVIDISEIDNSIIGHEDENIIDSEEILPVDTIRYLDDAPQLGPREEG